MKSTHINRDKKEEHNRHFAKDALLGVAVGDALGVPVEFVVREDLEIFPVKGMRGYGTHHQPPGTWSDDSSLTFCLAESVIAGFSLKDLAQRMVQWYEEGYWTAHGEVFDIGNATRSAIKRLSSAQMLPAQAGGKSHHDNGNGSLMRILPLVFQFADETPEERYRLVGQVSGLTHGHFRSIFSCFIYLEIARLLLQGGTPQEAYQGGIAQAQQIADARKLPEKELRLFERVLDGRLPQLQRFQIHSSGYVLHSLEASLWSWLTTESYEEAVLTAINLGADTDTNGAITGGLAGLTYGHAAIPMDWITHLQRKGDIVDLADRLHAKLHQAQNGGAQQGGMVA